MNAAKPLLPTREQLGTAAAKAIIHNLPVDGFGDSERLETYARIWGNAAADAALALLTAADADSWSARLAAAEDVCVMFAWSPIVDTDPSKATQELWRRWVDLSGNDCSPDHNPHLTDELISELAAQRDATRARVLALMLGTEWPTT